MLFFRSRPNKINWYCIFTANQHYLSKFSATFFIFLYMVAMARPIMPVVEYVIEHDYIAEFLCINKDKPELDCEGKCYLMQQLAAQDDEKRQNLPRIAMEEYPIGFVEILTIAMPKIVDSVNEPSFVYPNDYHYLYSYSDFHPPS